MSKTNEFIIECYLKALKENGGFPSYAVLHTYGVSKDNIKYHFGNMENLKTHILDNFSDEISKYFSTVDDIFQSNPIISKKVLVITTAVADAKAHEGFIRAMQNYVKERDGQLIILPCESITNSFENKTATFDSIFSDSDITFVRDTVDVNNNLTLASIQVSAKQIKPTTGLSRIGRREGSYIFAAPKQFLEYVPSGNSRDKNYGIMTPGACTLPNYYTNQFVSKRLSYIAHNDHTLGAIIVEIEDENLFHFRQIQADPDGSFYDLGKLYTSDNRILENYPVSLVLGDLHGVQCQTEVLENFIRFVKENKINVENIFLHDVFDGLSVSHHISTIGAKSKKAISNLEDELVFTYNLIDYINQQIAPTGKVYIVKSNHDEFLDRYLTEGRYITDPENHKFALKCALGLFEYTDTLKYAFEECGLEIAENIVFLSRSDSVEISGIELGSHGDLGLNGARSSLNSLEKIYGSCVTAHSHSPAIQRSVFRVGTFTVLDMGYNRGPSSWMHTACLVYNNGQRQLVNQIGEKFSLNG